MRNGVRFGIGVRWTRAARFSAVAARADPVNPDYTHPGTTSTKSGAVLHFQDIENYMFVQVTSGASDTVSLYKVVAGHPTQLAISGSFTLGGSDTVKCVITESGGAQTLTVYVAGTSRLSTGAIDDVWASPHPQSGIPPRSLDFDILTIRPLRV